MEWLGTLLLYLHVGGVIVAFGPTIAFPFLGAKAAEEPMHGNFTLRASDFISRRVVEPGAIFVFVMGAALIVVRGYNPLVDLWVGVAIILFLITFGYANLVQGPTVKRLIELTMQPPVVAPSPQAGERPAMSGPGATEAAGTAPAGPPPEFVALSRKAARGGMFMLVMLFVILALMIFKPF